MCIPAAARRAAPDAVLSFRACRIVLSLALLAPHAARARPGGAPPPAEPAVERVGEPAADPRPARPEPVEGTTAEPPADDELSELIGPELAAELRADEAAITGETAADPAYLSPGGGADSRSGGTLGASNLMNPAISLVVNVAGSYFTDETHVARGGHVPTENGIHVQEAEFAVEAAVDPYFHLKGYFVFGLTFFETEEVYAETLRLPGGLKVRLGQMLAPFGRTNPTHPHAWEFVDAPLPSQRFFSGEGLRSPGLELSWLAPLPFYLKAYASASMPDVPQPGSSPDEATFGADEDDDFLYLGRLETFLPLSDSWSLLLGASALTGPSGQGAGTRSEVFGGDLFLRHKPTQGSSHFEFDLTFEGAFRQRQFPANRLADWAISGEAALRLAQQWKMAFRGDAAEGDLVRGATMTGPAVDMGEERGTMSVTFFPTEFSLLRLQGTLSHPHGEAWSGPEWVGEVFVQAGLVVGAHGAHPF
ncbi:MAG: hypothetical protein HY907_05880 [Deltaproteobacteria bacterium]|nr:hypothetical protein [Deltaproteobacteria bacterium]